MVSGGKSVSDHSVRVVDAGSCEGWFSFKVLSAVDGSFSSVVVLPIQFAMRSEVDKLVRSVKGENPTGLWSISLRDRVNGERP